MKSKSKQSSGLAFVVTGLILILVISMPDGFTFSFVNAIQHIISDLTIDIKVHAYIAGLVLFLYGIYKNFAR